MNRQTWRFPRAYTSLFALYLLGFLPLVAIVGTLEGGLRGHWGLGPHDWVDQLGGALVLDISWLGPAGLISAGALVAAMAWAVRLQRRWRLLVAALSGVGAFALGAFTISLFKAVAEGTAWWAPIGLLLMPGAFVICPAVYGITGCLVLERQWRQQQGSTV